MGGLEAYSGKFSPDTVGEFFRLVWSKSGEEEEGAGGEAAAEETRNADMQSDGKLKKLDDEEELLPEPKAESEEGTKRKRRKSSSTSSASKKRPRQTSASPDALKMCCQLLQLFVEEAVSRASDQAEVEGGSHIECSHLERVLPQLLLDF
eukprot:TRINITY_DN1982_c0_g1_i2.p1 TRINITY_DN1982_c0_g1~~TRINITY_DN1982_c0_g1_i2.p1  ORF type:complete len:150 (-),score=50.29 TRINITY_DN1982_c0_g1_i2:115-564(-)